MAEKDRRHQTYVIRLLTIFLWFFVMPGGVSAEEATSERKAEDSVSVFVDRTTIKEGESLKLFVKCELPYTLLSEPEILFSDSFSLQPTDVASAELPYKREYLITGTKAGKYNIQVRVKYKADASEGTIIREIKDIDVQKGNNLEFWKTLVGLIPIVVGALLGFTASLGTSLFNAWKEQRKKKEWILNSLLPQLRVAQNDIAKGEPVGYEIWMKEFYEGGYYSALQKLSGKLKGKPDLCGDMVAIHSLLKRYERELEKVSIEEEIRNELQENLSKVIEALEPLLLGPR